MKVKETDEQLYSRFLSGNEDDALGILFERYHVPLTLFINRIVHNIDDSEEIMMDCFAIVISRKSGFLGLNNSLFKTWLYSVAVKQASRFLRKNLRTDSVPFEDYEDILKDPEVAETVTIKSERDKALYKALDKLPLDYRTALYLTYFEDMDADTAGKVMRKTRKQVYNLLARGKASAKEELFKEGFEWDM